MHAVLALLAALETRNRAGEGMLVEVTMVEAALNAAAEQVVEHSAHGTLLRRHGNRGPVAAPQGLYPCAGTEQWLALAVVTDEHWSALRRLMGDPEWARSVDRRADHDRVDEELAAWCADRDLDELVEALAVEQVPAAPVIAPRDVDRNPQLQARNFFEALAHPVTGTHALPGIPFRFASRADRPWYRAPAPLLGQHNDEVLAGELGLTATQLADLRARDIIGERPLGT
jgi:crotonobetainyl-CoA:carnitine CoA-transferase CaiB-like acyl-CoA transferase